MPITFNSGTPKNAIHSPEEKKKRRQARVLLESGIVLVVLFFIGILRVLAFESTLVVSRSMEPLIHKGDYTLVDHRVSLRHQWQRGDVVVFDVPDSWGEPGTPLVKRIIGLPGEEFGMFNGQVLINGQPLPENYFGEVPDADNYNPIKLGPDEYFVMGDNRNNSDDGRDHGPVEEKYIRGRIIARVWPTSRFKWLSAPDYSGNEPQTASPTPPVAQN